MDDPESTSTRRATGADPSGLIDSLETLEYELDSIRSGARASAYALLLSTVALVSGFAILLQGFLVQLSCSNRQDGSCKGDELIGLGWGILAVGLLIAIILSVAAITYLVSPRRN